MSRAVEPDRARRSARSGGAAAGRPSSCRSPTRRRARASRRGGCRSSTPSTAWTLAIVRWRTPPRIGKYLTRSRTSTSGWPAAGRRAGRRGSIAGSRSAASCAAVLGRPSCPRPPRRRVGDGARRQDLVRGDVGPRHPAVGPRDRPAVRRRGRASSGPRGPARAGGARDGRRRPSRCPRRRASAQRGANRQPFGRSIRFGHVARDHAQLVADVADDRDRGDQARGCRGAAGRRKSVVTSVCSTISPAYITATRSHISATTPRSWVIRMIAVPVSLAEVRASGRGSGPGSSRRARSSARRR